MKAIISKPENYNNSTPHEKYPIITVNANNPEFGFIMLRSNTLSINDGGFRQEEKRVGRYVGKVEDLVKDVETYGLKEGMDFSVKMFPVKLVIKESFEPAYEGHSPKINPSTNETITFEGAPVYRNTLVLPESSVEEDVKLGMDREPVASKTEANTEFAARK